MATYKVGEDGKAPSGLKAGDKVVTAAGTYTIHGVKADGSYDTGNNVPDKSQTTSNYTGQYATNPTPAPKPQTTSSTSSGVDYSLAIKDAIGRGATAEEVQSLLDQRNAKIDAAGGSLDQYRNDDYTSMAQRYIQSNSMPDFDAIMSEILAQMNATGEYDLSQYITQMQKGLLEDELAGLKGAYEKNMSTLDDAAERIPQVYDAASNELAAQNALAKKAFDERAVASGLNTGTAGQAELARGSVMQGNLATVAQAQADAMADLELQRTNIQTAYENAIAEATARGQATLANALYDEMLRLQGLQQDGVIVGQQSQSALGQLLGSTPTGNGGGDTPAPKPAPKPAGYNNGNYSTEEIKGLQNFLGMSAAQQDGLYGKQSEAKAAEKGYSSLDAAMAAYRAATAGGGTTYQGVVYPTTWGASDSTSRSILSQYMRSLDPSSKTADQMFNELDSMGVNSMDAAAAIRNVKSREQVTAELKGAGESDAVIAAYLAQLGY